MLNTKCQCGSAAKLHRVSEQARVGDHIVLVHNAPHYICNDCNFSFLSGPQALLFNEYVKKAVCLGLTEITIEEESFQFDQIAFSNYLYELQTHLFGEKPLNEIINDIQDNHRARRFVAMYLLKDRQTFHSYYLIRKELRLEFIFDTVIAALFSGEINSPKQILIDVLNVSLEMADKIVEDYPLREFDKDLNSFLTHWRKRNGYFKRKFRTNRD